MGKRTRYYPPASDIIDSFSRAAYRGLGRGSLNTDSVYEFAGFIKAVARAYAHDLNRELDNELDNGFE